MTCAMHAMAQSVEVHVVVTLNDGVEHVYLLTDDDQFSFEGQENLLITSQGSTESIAIDNIRNIVFVDTTDSYEILDGSPYFYPNPAKKSITIGNIGQNQMVSIYSIDGHLAMQFQANANERIDISQLQAGMYLIKIGHRNHKLWKL